MKIVALIYPDYTMLDMIGPLEVLSMIPGAEISVVSKVSGVVWPDHQVLPVIAPYGIDAITSADILLIPGGPGCVAVSDDEEIVEWVRSIHKTTSLTCSVCTGSLILGAAGLLEGLPATTHWTTLPLLEGYGATPVSDRWVRSGKVMTAAGVSAGIDMALELVREIAGEKVARAAQLALEYDPHPPLDSGNHLAAPDEVKAAVLNGTITFDRRMRPRPMISAWSPASPAKDH